MTGEAWLLLALLALGLADLIWIVVGWYADRRINAHTRRGTDS